MIDEQKFCDQPVKNDLRAYDNVQNITRSRRLLNNWLFTKLSLI